LRAGGEHLAGDHVMMPQNDQHIDRAKRLARPVFIVGDGVRESFELVVLTALPCRIDTGVGEHVLAVGASGAHHRRVSMRGHHFVRATPDLYDVPARAPEDSGN
jgi:hypothetical protein